MSFSQLPPTYSKGDLFAVKIEESVYQQSIKNCQNNLIGRFILPKGSQPLKVNDLHRKSSEIWKRKNPWKISPIGKGHYCLQFANNGDLNTVWTAGPINLHPGSMKLSLWCKDFVPEKQKQTNAQAWVRLHNLPFEYWHPRILLSIASILGSPVKIDQATLNREFFHYARIQIDIDLQFELQHRVLVERDGFRFEIPVTYEKLP